MEDPSKDHPYPMRSEYDHLEGFAFDLFVVKLPNGERSVEVPAEQEVDEVVEDFLFNAHDEDVETLTDCFFFMLGNFEYGRIRPGLWKLRLEVYWVPENEDPREEGFWMTKIVGRQKI